ncbi:scavenger receptor cysteine-rich domain-containing protein DMBT1-like [Phyllobates terribilis]|uniref:scavenger receptor cysteine-rich domain-containing protein DMBT1-like n=1 Tax=Phyllobates terribilis TaxID=111132 RepID=UPI003CCB4632
MPISHIWWKGLDMSLRLVNGNGQCNGRVEILYNGAWGTVCDDYWDINAAQVVCRQLNCGQALAFNGSAAFGQGQGLIVLDDVQCSGNEQHVWDCPHQPFTVHNCEHNEDAGVVCSGSDMSLRLVNGNGQCNGRVEILYNGAWGTVCDDYWDINAAQVVCQQLNCGQALAFNGSAAFGQGQGLIVLDDVQCTGNELHVWDCPHQPFTVHNCGHNEDAGVVCSDMSLRLVNGNGQCNGRVEILYNGAWGTVCDDYWDINAAQVVCRQLNCGQALAFNGSAAFGQGQGLIVLDDVQCTGNEQHVWDCPHQPFTVHNCGHNEDAGIDCSGSDMSLRLVNGNGQCNGRVEILYNGAWGTVCDDYWDINAAQVVCRQLNCGQALAFNGSAAFGQGQGLIVLDDVQCTGNELHVWDCPHQPFTVHNCGHNEDAGVVCSAEAHQWPQPLPRTLPTQVLPSTTHDSSSYMSLRLVNGNGQCNGRVEILYNGAWGTVCDDYWDINAAQVVCRQLNCGQALAFNGSAAFGQGQGLIVLDDVQCTGNELHVWDCPHQPFTVHNCGHNEDAGVVCSDMSLRLVNGNGQCNGRVEILYNGAWGTVCDDYWDINAAQVVCRQLNCGQALAFNGSAAFGQGQGLIVLDDVQCTGNEQHVWDCPHQPFTVHNCGHNEDAGVVCSGPTNKIHFYFEKRARLLSLKRWLLMEIPEASNCFTQIELLLGRHPRGLLDIAKENWEAEVTPHWSIFEHVAQMQERIMKVMPITDGLVERFSKNLKAMLKKVVEKHGREWDYLLSFLLFSLQYGQHPRGLDIAKESWEAEVTPHRSIVECVTQMQERIAKVMPIVKSPPGAGSPESHVRVNLKPYRILEARWQVISDKVKRMLHLGVIVGSKSWWSSPIVLLSKPNGSSDMSLTLVNGNGQCNGRVEILYNGAWGTVCDDYWDINAAQVVCRQLNCGQALAFNGSAAFGQGQGLIVLDDVQCTGNELHVWDCPHQSFTVHNCGHNEDAGVVCSGIFEWMSLRLVNGNGQCNGRVEILYNGAWGTVCDDYWDINAAQVVCRQLKCGQALAFNGSAAFGQGQGLIVLDDVQCTGNEQHVWDCPHQPFTVHNCGHNEDAGVVCSDMSLRLVNGNGQCNGRVEILYNGAWGTVCDDYWDINAAEVVCRQLNCGQALAFNGSAAFGQGQGLIVLDDVQCTGNELHVWDCPHQPFTVHNCGHNEDAGVVCSGLDMSLRLVNGNGQCNGRVEILYNGAWGTVCDDYWDINAAQVVCRQLNCGQALAFNGSAAFGQGQGLIVLDDVQCSGNEQHVWDCPHQPFTVHNCGHNEDAGVVCSGSDMSLRLVNGNGQCNGRVEILYNGAWGTVCDDYWDINAAQVVCQQLNCGQALAFNGSAAFGQGQGLIVLDDVQCTGNELHVWNCPHQPFTVHNCGHNEDAGVVCSGIFEWIKSYVVICYPIMLLA